MKLERARQDLAERGVALLEGVVEPALIEGLREAVAANRAAQRPMSRQVLYTRGPTPPDRPPLAALMDQWLSPFLYEGPGSTRAVADAVRPLAAELLGEPGVLFQDLLLVPGVSSLQALLARMGLEHARPESGCPLAIYAPGRDPGHVARVRLEGLAALGIPLALFLADRSLAEVVEIGTRHFGPGGRVVIGYRVGWPDERIIDCTLAELLGITDGTDVPYHTIVLVGPWHG